jgi:hypothetical protein
MKRPTTDSLGTLAAWVGIFLLIVTMAWLVFNLGGSN